MQSLAILIPVALILVAVAIALFLWAVRSDQFEDLERRGSDILFDDDMPGDGNGSKAEVPDDDD